MGASNDLQIWHSGSNSIIQDSGVGNLFIQGGNSVKITDTSANEMAVFNDGGSVELYYDNSKKFETTGYGVTVFGGLLVSGITTYQDTTDNTLGDADTGAFQIDGGLGVNKNVTVGGNLNVQGYSEFIGVATFRGGTINIGDANTDNVNIGGEFISNLVPNDDDSYDIGITTQRWRDGNFSGIVTTNNLYAAGITTTVLFNVGIGGTVITTTTGGLVGINSTAPTTTLDVGGDINFSGNLRQRGSLFTAGIGIQSGGNVIVGSGATILNFVGTAVSAVTDAGGGIVDVNLKVGEFTKSTSNFTASAGQTTFNVNYTPNYVDVFVNGVRLTASEFTATNGTSVVLSEGANLNDIVDIVVYQNSGLFDGSKWTAETPDTPSSGNIYRMNGNVGIATTNPTSKLHILGDALVSGVVTATGGYKIGIQSSSTNITTGVITALNFIGAGNTFQYNAGTKTVDISIGGGQWTYANESDTENSNVYRLNGNVGLGTTNPVAKLDVSGILGIQGNTTSISTTTATTIDILPIATYRSARFQIQITQSNDYQSTDLMAVHDGTTATNIEYGSIATNNMLASFSSTISGSNLLLTVSMASAGIATVKVARYGITV